MFNFGFDPEQFASLGSSFDEPDPFAPVSSEKAPVKQTATDIVDFANNLQNTRQTARDELGAGSYDANDWAQIAMATPEMEENYRWGTESTKIWNNYQDDFRAYVEDNDIPLTQERDGVTYYLTTDQEGRNDRELGGNYDNFLHGRVSDGVWIDQGPAGTYSTRYVDTSTSFGNSLLENPVLRAAAAIATNGISEGVIAAGRGLTGETLHLNDYASMAMAGYNYGQGNTGFLDGAFKPTAPTTPAGLFDVTGSALGTAAEGMSYLDAANLAYQGYNITDEYQTAQDEEDKAKADAIQAAIDLSDKIETEPVGKPPPIDAGPITPPVIPPPPTEDADDGGAGGSADTGGTGTGGDVGGAEGGTVDDGGGNTSGGVATKPSDPVEPDPNGRFEYDPTQFEDTFGDTWNNATFETLDANNDGIVTDAELDAYERSLENDADPVLIGGTGGGVDTGGSEDTGGGTTTGGGDGSGGDTGSGAGGGDGTGSTTGGSTGGGTGAGDGTGGGSGDGSGDGTGTGDGTGDGTGSGDGSGDGDGDGDGSGVGIGSSGMLSPQRTTDDLFFKELFQMNTQARDTQQIVRAGQPLQTFQQQQRQLQPVNRPRLGMLTDPELLKRYKY